MKGKEQQQHSSCSEMCQASGRPILTKDEKLEAQTKFSQQRSVRCVIVLPDVQRLAQELGRAHSPLIFFLLLLFGCSSLWRARVWLELFTVER